MVASVMAFLRCHNVMFTVVKFCAALVIGFGLGVYFLPIWIAAKSPDSALIAAMSDSALRRGTFVWNLPGSGGLHSGDGVIMVIADRIWLGGKVAPGSDYSLYLTLKYDETVTRLRRLRHNQCKLGCSKRLRIFHSI